LLATGGVRGGTMPVAVAAHTSAVSCPSRLSSGAGSAVFAALLCQREQGVHAFYRGREAGVKQAGIMAPFLCNILGSKQT